jgi:hypothetical protein
MCFSPNDVANKFGEVDTAKLFKEIHLIALECYFLINDSDPAQENYDKADNKLILTTQDPDRLKSSVLNS